MLKLCKSVDSLAKRDLEYKYGPSWVCDNDIDTGRLIGTGGIGKVYAGLHKGTPVAYKVINQMKTPDAMLRFVRKCVLPVVNVQLLSTFPSDHPHLLHLHDCIMFPQYSSLLLLAGGTLRAHFSHSRPKFLVSLASASTSYYLLFSYFAPKFKCTHKLFNRLCCTRLRWSFHSQKVHEDLRQK